jgi:hypothetical protein
VNYARISAAYRSRCPEEDVPWNAIQLEIRGPKASHLFMEVDLVQGYAVSRELVFSKRHVEVIKLQPGDLRLSMPKE